MSKNDVSAFTQATGAGSAGGTSGMYFQEQNGFVERFLRRSEVIEMTSIPTSTLTDYCRMGVFPKPYRLNPGESTRHGSAVWKLSEVLAFMNSRPRAE